MQPSVLRTRSAAQRCALLIQPAVDDKGKTAFRAPGSHLLKIIQNRLRIVQSAGHRQHRKAGGAFFSVGATKGRSSPPAEPVPGLPAASEPIEPKTSIVFLSFLWNRSAPSYAKQRVLAPILCPKAAAIKKIPRPKNRTRVHTEKLISFSVLPIRCRQQQRRQQPFRRNPRRRCPG